MNDQFFRPIDRAASVARVKDPLTRISLAHTLPTTFMALTNVMDVMKDRYDMDDMEDICV